jgi:hypothetical protein
MPNIRSDRSMEPLHDLTRFPVDAPSNLERISDVPGVRHQSGYQGLKGTEIQKAHMKPEAPCVAQFSNGLTSLCL